MRIWTGFMWLRTGSSGHERQRISWLAERLSASHKGLSFMKLWPHRYHDTYRT
jgi:hypothetical protein